MGRDVINEMVAQKVLASQDQVSKMKANGQLLMELWGE